MDKNIVKFLQENVKEEFFKNKLFYTKDYPLLEKEILDEKIIITNAIAFSDYPFANENTKDYLANDNVFPFLDTLGGNLIGIGFGTENKNLVYYFDNDFELFQLGGDDFYQFCQKLKPANYDWLQF